MRRTQRQPLISRRRFGAVLLAPCLGHLAGGCKRLGRSRGSEPNTTAPHDAGAATTRVTVDIGAVTGAFERLSGVQGSPHPIVDDDIDHRQRYREHRIAHVRFPQDCPPNTLTLGAIFPDEDADPADAASYHFAAIDKHIAAARAAGATILWQSSYDVGRSDRWMGINLGGRAPHDLQRWSRVVAGCLEHFNNGWAGGMDYAVRNVEFVNEPNGLGGFGGPRLKELIPAFVEFVRTVNRYNRAHTKTPVRAVGPGIPFALPDWSTWQPRFTQLLTRLRETGVVLPVFSFHTYGSDTSPQANQGVARALRKLLDAHGMQTTELWNTEWQGGDFLRKHLGLPLQSPRSPSALQLRQWGTGLATYALSCKIRWQGWLTGSYYYRANMRAFGRERLGRELVRGTPGYSLLFSPRGEVRPLALQEKLTAMIARDLPGRCETHWEDDGLLTALGLASSRLDRVGLLLCNLSPEPRSVSLELSQMSGRRITRATAIHLSPEQEALVEKPLAPGARRGRSWQLDTTIAPLATQLGVLELS